jgi:hypothetical protein
MRIAMSLSLSKNARPTLDHQSLLSLVWLFVLLNFLYCDVVGLHDAAVLSSLLDGRAGDLEITPAFLLASSVLMEIPIAMVLVTRLASRRVGRTASIVAASFMTIVQSASLFVGVPSPSYAFFSAIEIATLIAIVLLAIRWPAERSAATIQL